jgi:glucosyl-dolichyl phosphate glucuronosyltransferase
MKISIGIPTKDNQLLLENCLRSLAQTNLSFASIDLEIIIVDSSKKRDLTKQVCNSSTLRKSIRILFEKRLGISFARNKIFKSASGEYLFFLDDDVTVTTEWLKTGVNFFRHHKKCGVVGGKLSIKNKPSKKAEADLKKIDYGSNFWPFTLFDLGRKERKLPSEIVHYPMFANMAIRRDFITNYQLDNRFANQFEKLKIYGGEDPDFIESLRGKCEVWYSPSMLGYHYVKPYKFSKRYFIWRTWENGKERALLDFKYKSNPEIKSLSLYSFLREVGKRMLQKRLDFKYLLNKVYVISYYTTYLRLTSDNSNYRK